MFRKKDDDTYAFSGRFWTYAVIATVLIGWIGWRTQDAADKTEVLAQQTTEYAKQTNDCLSQVIRVLVDRSSTNKEVEKVNDHRWELWTTFIVSLSQISTDQPQSERDKEAAPIVNKYLTDLNQVAKDRAELLARREAAAFPDPSCGSKLPGQ